MSIMTAMPQGAAVEGINPNLLDNWYFVGGGSQQGGGQFPINQRGATSYSAANYTMDRWVGGAATTQVTINANSIQFSSSTQDSVAYLMQYVKETLVGKTVTISAIIDGQLQVNTGTVTADSNLETTNLLLRTLASGKTQFRFKVTSTTGVAITAAKLELGDQQTLVQNLGTTSSPNWVLNEIPDYGIEVLKCETSIADNADPESNLKAVTNKATFIHSSLNLNDYKQPGVYWWTNAPVNAPTTSGIGSWLNGWLYVYKSDDGSRVMQEVLYNPGSTGEASPVVRMYGNNTWGPWRTIDRSLNENLTLHVNQTSGSDSNDGLSAATALATIAAALGKIPRNHAGHKVTIALAAGTYSAVVISGLIDTSLTITNENTSNASGVIIPGINISGCLNAFVTISYITLTGNLVVNRTDFVRYFCLGCVFNGATCYLTSSHAMLQSCTFRNISGTAISCDTGMATVWVCTIENSCTVGVSSSKGIVTVNGGTNSATTPYSVSDSGRIFVGEKTYSGNPTESIYYTGSTVNITGGNTDLTLSRPMNLFSTILLYLTSNSTNASGSRCMLRFNAWELNASPMYPITIDGTHFYGIRIGFKTTGDYTTLRIVSTTAPSLYIVQAIGVY